MKSKKFLLLFVSFLLAFLFLIKTSFSVLASCIPSNTIDPTGCQSGEWGYNECGGVYAGEEILPSPISCSIGETYRRFYYCVCEYTTKSWYSCSATPFSGTTYTHTGSSLETSEACASRKYYTPVSREIATNQTACNNWCLPTTPTLARTCTGQYYQKSQCAYRYVGRTDGVCDLNGKLGTINRNNLNDPINTWKWSWCTNSSTVPVTPTSTPRPTPTPTKVPVVNNCSGRYFGRPQCDWANRGKTGGSCQLNPNLGTILPNNPNYWKWSWCNN